MKMTEYYSEMLEKGLKYQDFVTELFYENGIPLITFQSKSSQTTGENKAGIEIKFDDMLEKTGNLYIETKEKTNPKNPNYIPSGIYRDDNTWLYAIGNYTVVYVFSKKRLKKAHASNAYRQVESGTKTSIGFLIPENVAVKSADKILRPKKHIEKVKG